MTTTTFIQTLLAAACVLACPASAKNVSHHMPAPRSDLEVTVYVAQSRRASELVQETSRAMVSQLFERIGISIRFAAESTADDSYTIALRIWERAPRGVEPNVLGSASLDQRQAHVFRDRVRRFHDSSDWREDGRILGYAIAHELGHILRAEPGHSPFGVMKACWMQSDITPMLQGTVSFSRSDADRIRTVLMDHRKAVLTFAGEN